MEANQYLNDFYNHYDEDSRLLFQHGSVEFLTTMRYIEKYLKHGDKVLEIGAGTGRYSHALARRGHPVDAVELVAHNIEVFRQNTRPGESVTIAQGNALDLSAFADNAYDVTLLLGPLYHLYTQDDKRRALREATAETTTIIVAQRISTILHADKIIVLDEGRMAGMGTHRELLENCEVYRQIAESQLSKEELAG